MRAGAPRWQPTVDRDARARCSGVHAPELTGERTLAPSQYVSGCWTQQQLHDNIAVYTHSGSAPCPTRARRPAKSSTCRGYSWPPRPPRGARHVHNALEPRAPLGDHRSGAPSPTFSYRKDDHVTSVRVDSQLAIAVNEGATASAVVGLGITAPSENSARAGLEAGQLVRVLPDWDFGSMEVNALFVSRKTIKPAARAFADFLLRELRAA